MRGSVEIAPDHGVGLDYGFAAEHDVLRSDQDRFAGYFVAGVLLDEGKGREDC